MKITFKIMTSLIPKVDEVAAEITKTFQAISGQDSAIEIGWQIGTVTIDVQDDETLEEKKLGITTILSERFHSIGVHGRVWLVRSRGLKEIQ